MRVGVNFWHAAWLGAEPPVGDPGRLARELDLLARSGATCVRAMAGAEGPHDAAERVAPPLSPEPGVWDTWLLRGLEAALDAVEARGMTAIVCLTNFWWWSGGLAQYRSWASAQPMPEPGSEGFETYSAGFYRDAAARALLDAHLDVVVGRLAGHPAIEAWEVCNEPRGKHDPEGMRAFLAETAERIRSIDAGARVASGTEGSTQAPDSAGLDFRTDHAHDAIDVTTCHLWPQNWGLWDPECDDDAQFEEVLSWSRAYLRHHASIAGELGKPLWIEELGLARDGGRLDASASTARRDRFFDAMLDEAARLEREGLPVAGLLLWAWSGEGGERQGDPPHEPAGWYGIRSTDASTLAVLARHTRVGAEGDRG